MMLPLRDQLIRICIAMLVGSLIGFERKHSGKKAGVRTHAIICIICTMLTIVATYGFRDIVTNLDPTRLLSNILTGVGFLSGGVIFYISKGENKTVKGLTTAAGIWGTACLGIPIGIGLYELVAITIIAIELVLFYEGALKRLVSKDDIENEEEI